MWECASMTWIFSPSTVIILPPRSFSERSESNIAGQHEVQYRVRMTLILNNDEIQQALTIKNSLDALEETYRELAQSGAVNCPISQTYLPHSLPQTSYSFKSVNGGVKTL